MAKIRSYIIDGKKSDIEKENWDFLIILDACRYDLFKEVYKDVLGNVGKFKRALSPATWTMEWLNKQFSGYYSDIIYISASPYVNSFKKICFKAKMSNRLCFDAKHHFFKIVDVWNFGWSDKLKTVHPIEVNKAFHKTYLRCHNKRFILHYMQPHGPHISLNINKDFSKLNTSTEYTTRYLGKILGRCLPEEIVWFFKKKLDMTASAREQRYRKYGKDGLFDIYKDEIVFVLNYVKMLMDSISGKKWLITSDHGERIGGIGRFIASGHSGGRDKAVIEVPWLEVQS